MSREADTPAPVTLVPVPGEDEDLPVPVGRHRGSGTFPLELGVAALVVVAGLLITRGGSSHASTAHRLASATPTATASRQRVELAAGPATVALTGTVRLSDGVIEAWPTLPARTSQDPAACPIEQCFTVDGVPGDVGAALRAAFPGARIESAMTVQLLGKFELRALWYRQVRARAGGVDILLRIQGPRPSDPRGDVVDRIDDRAITYFETDLLQWHVALEVDAPYGHVPLPAQLTRLASDRRVLVTP